MKRLLLIAFGIALLVLILAAALPAKGRKPSRIARGAWGGEQVRMDVSATSATIEFACAHGQIVGPLTTDRRGRFDLRGTFYREHGGPIRDDEKPDGQAARYTGWSDGKKMTLTVTLIHQKEAIGTFNLSLGGGGRLLKCL